MGNFHVYNSENAYIIDLIAWIILINVYVQMYFRRRNGVGALMHVYVCERIVCFYCRTARLTLRKLGRDEQHIARTRIKAFWPNPPRDGSRAGQKIGHEAPFFRPKGYSNKPFMHSNCLIAPVRRLFHYDVTIKWPVKWLIGCGRHDGMTSKRSHGEPHVLNLAKG